MIRAAIEKILSLAITQELEINGHQFTNKSIVFVPDALPENLAIETLGALCEYIMNDPDGYESEFIIHVAGYNQVDLYLGTTENTLVRPHLLRVELCSYKAFPFGRWLPPEEFIIGLQSQFVQEENVEALQKIGGGLKSERAGTIKDDGVSQEVTLQEGTRLTEEKIPNPVTLTPYRTFLEIDQPPSDFVFRLKTGHAGTPECALFEGDGGAWKIEAIASIAEFIEGKISDKGIILS